ncbi:uncharacterized protein LOC117584212 [Drosophila guanche]|uniref:Uncharacterized protein n=1 Tax=Drosophila guanche TaxID=7266 RepID=A0A3B0JI79_DROGU|nr:uncharacterized protein LOC117584212 [Drosophila guanche]SPP82114.1 Hypothetical predicted protein [Drosophila guanche]
MKQDQIIFTDQLLHHRCVASRAEETRKSWMENEAWYPVVQRQLYSRYGQIYKECLEQYGNASFEYFAKRIRLRKDFQANTAAAGQEQERESEISMDHLKDYKVSKTTNGEYGLVKPSRIFYCF